jgi:hypothetical protein
MFDDADLIHSYTRADAIADGSLVDVSESAREAGFRVPVALTLTVWVDCVSWGHDADLGACHQDETGRLWDVLWMARLAGNANKDAERVAFQVNRVPRGSRTGEATPVTLLLDIGPGDAGEPVVTIGLAEDF